MVSVNYLVLAGTLIPYYWVQGKLILTGPVLEVGVLTGCTFVIAMLVMTRALEIADVAAVLTAFRLGILLPIAIAVWLWGETASTLQIAGITLALLSLILMTRGKNTTGARTSNGHLLLVLLVFGLQGLSQTCLRWVHYADLDPQRQLVLLVTALTAGLLGAFYVVICGHRPQRADLAMGAGIGLFNLICLVVILTALTQVQGTVFFPLQGCAVVIMDNLFAHFFWKEPLGRTAVTGAALGAISMLLIL